MEFLLGFVHSHPADKSGGLTALKKLVGMLSDRGHTVYVLHDNFMTKNSKLISNVSELDMDKVIVIYPEIVKGNPYNGKNVVRWILYHTKNEEMTWSETDVYFYYNDYFRTKKQKERLILNCYELRLDELKDFGLEREGYCHIYRPDKTPNDFMVGVKYNSEDLIHGFFNKGWDWLINKFNTKEYFITHDDATYFSIIASLCGCKSIILYETKKDNFKERNPLFKYGVAYGFEELDESIKTRSLMRQHLMDMDKNSHVSVDNFIKYWEDFFKKNQNH
jgi:hypothetical protein